MAVAAQRTREADEEWRVLRRRGLRACAGLLGEYVEELPFEDVLPKRGIEEVGDGEVDIMQVEPKRRRMEELSEYPLGVYEPNAGVVFCEYLFLLLLRSDSLTYPTSQTAQTPNQPARAGRPSPPLQPPPTHSPPTSPRTYAQVRTRSASSAGPRSGAARGASLGSTPRWRCRARGRRRR